MEFDKSRVYTVVNADELKIGSKCIFADNLDMLRKKIPHVESYISELVEIKGDLDLYRFRSCDNVYALAYLIEPPEAPEFKPFSSTAKAMEVIKKHGGWVKSYTGYDKDIEIHSLITGISIGNLDEEGKYLQEIEVHGLWFSAQAVFNNYVFADDDSPCGELVES